jgi:hypothetical protein
LRARWKFSKILRKNLNAHGNSRNEYCALLSFFPLSLVVLTSINAIKGKAKCASAVHFLFAAQCIFTKLTLPTSLRDTRHDAMGNKHQKAQKEEDGEETPTPAAQPPPSAAKEEKKQDWMVEFKSAASELISALGEPVVDTAHAHRCLVQALGAALCTAPASNTYAEAVDLVVRVMMAGLPHEERAALTPAAFL